jgi:hypothetical protein
MPLPWKEMLASTIPSMLELIVKPVMIMLPPNVPAVVFKIPSNAQVLAPTTPLVGFKLAVTAIVPVYAAGSK